MALHNMIRRQEKISLQNFREKEQKLHGTKRVKSLH